MPPTSSPAPLVVDPHFLPGNISGAGMERTPNGRVVDTRYAVVLDYIDGCLIEHPGPGQPMYALALAGSINNSEDRARCLFLIAPEGAGVLIDRLVNLAGMIGPEFSQRILERVKRLSPAEQHTDPELHTEPPRREAMQEAPAKQGVVDPNPTQPHMEPVGKEPYGPSEKVA